MIYIPLLTGLLSLAAVLVLLLQVRTMHRQLMLALRREWRLSHLAEMLADWISDPCEEKQEAAQRAMYEVQFEYTRQKDISWRTDIPETQKDWNA